MSNKGMDLSLWVMLFLYVSLVSCGGGRNVSYEVNQEKVMKEVSELMFSDTVSADSRPQDIVAEYEALLSDILQGTSKFERTTLLQLGDLYLDRSIGRNKKVLPKYSKRADRRQRGRLSFNADLRNSIGIYKQILSDYPAAPENSEVLYRLAHAYSLADDKKNVRKVLERMTVEYPDNSYKDEVYFRLGEIYFADGDMDAAIKAYTEALEKKDSKFFNFAVYKLGWAYFNSGAYDSAVKKFLEVLDNKLISRAAGQYNAVKLTSFSGGEGGFVKDCIKGASMSFTYIDDPSALGAHLKMGSRKLYAEFIYKQTADLYIAERKVEKAVNVFSYFTTDFPFSSQAPKFKEYIISDYSKYGLIDLANEQRQEYVSMFGPESAWLSSNQSHKEIVLAKIKKIIDELARYYHSRAQETKESELYEKAFFRYRQYLEYFPDDILAGKMSFLLAEGLFEQGDFEAAYEQYKASAYKYPGNKKSGDSAYAAIYALQKGIDAKMDNVSGLKEKLISEGIRFFESFPEHESAQEVILYMVNVLYEDKDYEKLREIALKVRQVYKTAQKGSGNTLDSVWYKLDKFVADSYFNEQAFLSAFGVYSEILKVYFQESTKEIDTRKSIVELAASSLYKSAEMEKQTGSNKEAFTGFMKVYEFAPDSKAAVVAIQDAFSIAMAERDEESAFIPLKVMIARKADYLESATDSLERHLKRLFGEGSYELLRSLGTELKAEYKKGPGDNVSDYSWFYYQIDKLSADSWYKEENYVASAEGYKVLLRDYDMNPEDLDKTKKLLASSLYKEAGRLLKKEEFDSAAVLFASIYKDIPEVELAPTGLFQTARIYIKLERFEMAEEIAQVLFSEYPAQSYGIDTMVLVAARLEELDRKEDAASKYYALGGLFTDIQKSEDAVYKAGLLYEESGNLEKALSVFTEYSQTAELEPSRLMDVLYRSATAADKLGRADEALQFYETISRVFSGASLEDSREKKILSTAYYRLGEKQYEQFEDIKINRPLKASLKKKKASLKKVLKEYSRAASMNVEGISTAATYKAGLALEDFITSLITSERPGKLTRDQLAEYDRLLKKQAIPYRKKTIKTQESNIKRTFKYGTYDEWIKKSYEALMVLLPKRYAKSEKSEIFSTEFRLDSDTVSDVNPEGRQGRRGKI